jgi:Flp pilus assembly protein TadD
MRRTYRTWTLVGVLACVAGCTCDKPADDAATTASATETTGAAAPVTNYKVERWRRAMAGITIEDGRLVVDPDGAAAMVAEAQPTTAAAQYELGREELIGNHYEASIHAFRNAIALDPSDPSSFVGLARAFTAKGRMDEALASYYAARDLDDARVDIHVGIADTLQRRGELSEAVDAWQLVIDMDPNDGRAHARLGTLLYLDGDTDGARFHIAQARALGQPVPAQLVTALEQTAPGS